MTNETELRDRIARVHFARSAENAARDLGLDEPVTWEQLSKQDHTGLLDAAQAIIDELELEVVSDGGRPEWKLQIVGKWEKK